MNTLSIKFIKVLLLIGCTQAVAADFRVGIVNTERILRESAPAVKAEKKIEKEFSIRDQEIKKIAKQVKDAQVLMDKEGLTLPDAEKRNKERELANLNMNLQRMQRSFSEDLNLRKNEEMSVVLEHANRAIQTLAEKEKYDLILQEAVYRSPNVDITDKVLKYMANEK
jgi:outer membrane protein